MLKFRKECCEENQICYKVCVKPLSLQVAPYDEQ